MAVGELGGQRASLGPGVPEHRGTFKGSALFPRGWEAHWVGGAGVSNQKELK